MKKKAEKPAAASRQSGRRASGTISSRLLAWYDAHARVLPWRAKPGKPSDPYRVWLSEIMLQQTTVAAVGPYFRAFVTRWPDVRALAAAPVEEVLAAWAGLGYYSRARNLHACARKVVADHDGSFPQDETALRALPGIGPYTAAAIAAIAFGKKATPVDGNIERVVARLFAITKKLPEAKAPIRTEAARLTPELRAGDFAQAIMDLGATTCTPRTPKCSLCPLAKSCRARKEGIAETLPRRAAKARTPSRFGASFVAITKDDRILLRRRAAKGLLGGMMETPSTAFAAVPPADALAHAPVKGAWQARGAITHVFTHFRLTLDVYVLKGASARALTPLGELVEAAALDRAGLATLFAKVIRKARDTA